MSGDLLALLGALLLALGVVGSEMLRQIVAREYDAWAPALARLLVRLAGRLHPPKAGEWRADIAYLQVVEEGSGLWAASSHLVAAPRLTGIAFGRWLRRAATGRELDAVELIAALAVGRERFGRGYAWWLRSRADEAGGPEDQAENVYRLAQVLASEPRVVSFVRSSDGSLRGFVAEGAHSEGVCVAASFYARNRRRIERDGRRIVVVEQDVLEAVRGIVDDTANFFGCELPERGCALTLVFEHSPPHRPCSHGWSEVTLARRGASLAERTLAGRRRWPASERGPLLRV